MSVAEELTVFRALISSAAMPQLKAWLEAPFTDRLVFGCGWRGCRRFGGEAARFLTSPPALRGRGRGASPWVRGQSDPAREASPCPLPRKAGGEGKTLLASRGICASEVRYPGVSFGETHRPAGGRDRLNAIGLIASSAAEVQGEARVAEDDRVVGGYRRSVRVRRPRLPACPARCTRPKNSASR